MPIERILWGDDGEDMLDLFGMVLRGGGFVVDTATTPEDVIRKAAKGKYDAIITDLNYTEDGGEGLEVIKAVKDKARYIILFTGDRGMEAKAKKAGADYVLYKPPKIEDLIHFLENLEQNYST